ncbi:MAG: hypothetical protein QW614_00175 [Candidatus Caldarchaeum sp.]|uniref:Carboxypeptidase regulatory-like domain-containing protein n=1 Tax=Caldiarchaeum subterraneum TaxID=311458 RepID=A0A7C5LDJ6_CALS0
MRALTIALTVMLVLPLIAAGQETALTLVVQVLTPDGLPKQGLTVVAEGANFRETAVTNATGHAVFKQLSTGSYELVVLLQNVELVRRGINFPETQSLVLVAPLSRLTVKVSNLAGRPADNLPVNLNSPTGVVSTSQLTNATGYVVFPDLPYSSVPRVGGNYSVKVLKDGVEVGKLEVNVNSPSLLKEMKASLVDVNFTATNRDGHAVTLEGTLTLAASNYTKRVGLEGGKALVKQLISTAVVGPYNTTVAIRLGQRNPLVYSSFLSVEADASINLPLDVGELQVRVLDPDGKPVKGVGLLVGAAGYGNFTTGVTGDDGTFSAGVIPYSTRVGEYVVSLFRGRTRIQAEPVTLDSSKKVFEITLRFQRLVLRVSDYAGRPLNNAEIRVLDPQTGRRVNTTTENGVASLNVFAGTNELIIIYKQKQVYRRAVDVTGAEMSIPVSSVNFPVTVRVLDGVGRFVEGLVLKVKVDGVEVVNTTTGSGPISFTMEVPGEVVAEVYGGGKLLAKDRVVAQGPVGLDIRFTDYISVGASLMPLQTLASIVLAVVLAAVAGVWVSRLLVKRQR